MTHDEKLFFKQLGARIAALRKDQGLTQVQRKRVAEAHGFMPPAGVKIGSS
jgi:transcriptional regulator with XRE-family HTH domain